MKVRKRDLKDILLNGGAEKVVLSSCGRYVRTGVMYFKLNSSELEHKTHSIMLELGLGIDRSNWSIGRDIEEELMVGGEVLEVTSLKLDNRGCDIRVGIVGEEIVYMNDMYYKFLCNLGCVEFRAFRGKDGQVEKYYMLAGDGEVLGCIMALRMKGISDSIKRVVEAVKTT